MIHKNENQNERPGIRTKCTQKKIFHKKVQITSTLINKLQQFKLYIVFTQVNNLSIHYNTML